MPSKIVSVLKERRSGEKRVILLPDAAREFVDQGFTVLVERDAGLLAGFENAKYAAAGAEIVDTETAWTQSPVVLKYKAPGPDEYRFFRRGMHLASFMHAEGNLPFVEAMRKSGMSAYALEFFRTALASSPFPSPITRFPANWPCCSRPIICKATWAAAALCWPTLPARRAPRWW
jgi:alanine dehydrogenase